MPSLVAGIGMRLVLLHSFLQVLDRVAIRGFTFNLSVETSAVLGGSMVRNLFVNVETRQGIRYMWHRAIDTKFLGDFVLVADLDIGQIPHHHLAVDRLVVLNQNLSRGVTSRASVILADCEVRRSERSSLCTRIDGQRAFVTISFSRCKRFLIVDIHHSFDQFLIFFAIAASR